MTKQLPMILGVGAAAGAVWWFFLRPQAARTALGRDEWQRPVVGPGVGRPTLPRPDLIRPGQPPMVFIAHPGAEQRIGHFGMKRVGSELHTAFGIWRPRGGSPYDWDDWVEEAPVLE